MPRHGGHVQGCTAPVIVGRVRNAHTGHPAFAIWCKEIDAVLGTGTCARTSPSFLHSLYDQGLPSSRAAAQIIMPRAMVGGCELVGGQPEIVGGLEIVGRGNPYEIVGRRGTVVGQRGAPPRGGGGGGGAAPRPAPGGGGGFASPRPAPGGGGAPLATRSAPGPGTGAPRGAPPTAFQNVVPTPAPAPAAASPLPPAALQNVNPSGLQNPSGAWTGHGGHGGHGHGGRGGGWWGGGWGWGWPWPWPYQQQPQPNDLSAIAAELNACGALSVNMDAMGNLVLTSHDPATTRSCVGVIYRGYPVIVQPA